ncbi:MAG: BtpA/SgcQ family protein [Chloroflexi bacterium]|nr:BtpA/SgcQ family protein [Chloroflexota bacterium]
MNTTGIPSSFRGTFKNRHVVLPVIHVESESQAMSNAERALDGGADGVFLINHSISSEVLLEIHDSVSDRLSDAWIGVNCLGLSPVEVFGRISKQVGGVWADNAMIVESREQQPIAQRILEARRDADSCALYFGGVAFKYQRHVHDLASAALKAAGFMDVVTTSGPGTGQAAHADKIRSMKQALGAFPLAIASGITPDNIGDYLPHSDCYLVATGISRSFTQLDEDLLDRLITRVRNYDA